MSVQTNQSVAEAARQHFNTGDVEAYLTTLYAPGCVAHYLPPGLPQGHAGLRLFYGAFAAGFPEPNFTSTPSSPKATTWRSAITSMQRTAANSTASRLPASGSASAVRRSCTIRTAR